MNLSRAHYVVPVQKAMSIRDMALLSRILTAAHMSQGSYTPCIDPSSLLRRIR